MNVIFKVGNIVEERADGLVCSGNVKLNMSGGVNGALLQGGGEAMQAALHAFLKSQGRAYVEPGFAMRIGPEPFHFKSIVYTVAIDPFYDSSVELVVKSLANAFSILAEDGCETVAVPALATGYGHLGKADFGGALRLCLAKRDWPFQEVRVVLKSDIDQAEVQSGYSRPASAQAERQDVTLPERL